MLKEHGSGWNRHTKGRPRLDLWASGGFVRSELAQPGNWQKHYHGDDKQLALARKYSFSDRARYYIGQPEITEAISKLFANLKEYPIPMNMLHQYMPVTYAKVRDGIINLNPKELALDGVTNFMLDYEYAVTV